MLYSIVYAYAVQTSLGSPRGPSACVAVKYQCIELTKTTTLYINVTHFLYKPIAFTSMNQNHWFN